MGRKGIGKGKRKGGVVVVVNEKGEVRKGKKREEREGKEKESDGIGK